MRYRMALIATVLVGCTSTKDTETIEIERDVRTYLDDDSYVMLADTIDARLKTHSVDKVAPLVVAPILAKWVSIEKAELDNAATLVKDRALGRGKDHCVTCLGFRKTLDVLAPASAELDTQWKTLQPKLTQAESAAYDAEKNDKRPIVVVWPEQQMRTSQKTRVAQGA